MHKIMLLGGGGFIGNALARALIEAGDQVLVLKRKGRGPANGAEYQRVDRREPTQVLEAIKAFKADILIDMIAMELADTQALLDVIAGKVERYVLISSCDVYAAFGRLLKTETGKIDNAPLCETSPMRTTYFPFRGLIKDRHDYDKIPLEHAALQQSGLEVLVLRLPMVIGPDDPRRRYQDLTKMLHSGENTLSMDRKFANWVSPHLHVDDVARAIAMAVVHKDSAGLVYNIGPDQHLSEAERALAFAKANGKLLSIQINEDKSGERSENFDQHIIINSDLLRHVTGWKPKLSPMEAFKSIWEWECLKIIS